MVRLQSNHPAPAKADGPSSKSHATHGAKPGVAKHNVGVNHLTRVLVQSVERIRIPREKNIAYAR